MLMCNLIEYNDNYSDSSGKLWHLKRDKIATNANVCNANSSSFKYKWNLIGNLIADGGNGKKEENKNSCTIKILENNF